MKDPKRVWAWVGVAVVVVAVVIGLVWRFWPSSAGPTPVFAPQGQLVANFPKQLILDPQAQVNDSYSINYDSATNQYTAEWTSSSSLVALYGDYQTYFTSNGWTITNQSGDAATNELAVLYATTSTGSVNVTIISQGQGSQVTVSYVAN